jgi:hypothetical protein
MSINDGLMEVAELRITTVNGTAGIGFHRLQFSLEIQLRATRGRIVQLGDLSAQVYAGTSASALKPLAIAQLGYLECLLVSLELPIAVPEELRNALAQLRAAHQDLIAGRYDSCIGRCRIAMDALEAVVGYGSAVVDVRQAFASKTDREAMAKRARADLVRLAVRHYTHLAHHVDDNGAPESFSRQDAMFILSATAGAVWDATAELRKRD